jgi:hypothetical protein
MVKKPPAIEAGDVLLKVGVVRVDEIDGDKDEPVRVSGSFRGNRTPLLPRNRPETIDP